MSYYYTDPANQPVGPVSLDELTELRRAGRIGDDSPVIEEGAVEWRACQDFVSPATLPWTPPAPPAPSRIILGLHPQRVSSALLAALGMLAIFLPWYHLPLVGSVLGTHDDSWWMFLALFIPALLVAFSGEKRGPLPARNGLVAAVPAALAACWAAVVIHDFYTKKESFDGDNPLAQAVASTVQVGVGPYLMMTAGMALVVVACLVPLYWRTPQETFVRWCAVVATIVGVALFVRFQLDHGLLVGVVLGAAIVGVAWLLLALWRVAAGRWRFRQMARLAVVLVIVLVVFLIGRLFWLGKTSVPDGKTTVPVASDTWYYVLYQGKHADYRLVVPSYLQEAQPPLDQGADRSFVGAGGMVISVYPVADQNRFWEDLKTSQRWREFKSGEVKTDQSRSKGAVTSQFFEIVADPVGGQQLTGVAVIVHADLTYALTLSVPAVWPQPIRLEAAWIMGQILGIGERSEEKSDSVIAELKQPHPYSQAPIFEQLQIAGLISGQLPKSTGQDQHPTRAQWKNKVTQNFGWLPGVPVTAQASRFQQVMGKPDDTQTLGDQTLWYYRCADGTIQLAMSALNLQTAGYMQAEVNDY